MAKWERVVAVLCFAYVVAYGIYFVTVVTAGSAFENPLIFPLHMLGMALSLLLVVLVLHDVYARTFPNPNVKVTWALLVLFANIFAIPIYLWKYGFKPRPGGPAGANRDAA